MAKNSVTRKEPVRAASKTTRSRQRSRKSPGDGGALAESGLPATSTTMPIAGPSRTKGLTAANLARHNSIRNDTEPQPTLNQQAPLDQPRHPSHSPHPEPNPNPNPNPKPAKIPTRRSLRIIKRSLTKLTNTLPDLRSEYVMLSKLLKVSQEQADEATIKAKQLMWLRFVLEEDVLKKMKRDRMIWDGTLVMQEEGGGEGWVEFLNEIKAEKEEMRRKEDEELDRRMEDIRKRREQEGSEADDEESEEGDDNDETSSRASSLKRGRTEEPEGEQEEQGNEGVQDRGKAPTKRARRK